MPTKKTDALFENVSNEDVAEVIKFYQENPVRAAEDIFNFPHGLPWHQRMALNLSWEKSDVIWVFTRGGGKSWMLALFSALSAILYPEEKIGIFGPSFRQSKFVFMELEKLYERSKIFQELCRKKPMMLPDVCDIRLVNGSIINALPLGDGSKIRGARYYRIIVDEAAQVPEDILDIVIGGMRATTKDPMESVATMKEQRRLIAAGKMKQSNMIDVKANKLLMASTAYYQFNHLYKRIQIFKREVESDDSKNPVIKVPDKIFWNDDRAVVMFTKDDPPEGFMNQKSIEEMRKKMSTSKFNMEYNCFATGTEVVTPNGAVNIEDLNIGDMVLTHKGRFRPIVKKSSRLIENEEVVSYRQNGFNKSVIVTREHPYWTGGDDFEPITDIDTVRLVGVDTLDVITPISKEYVQYTGNVYNLEVEEDNSYSLIGATVHNCFFPPDSQGFFRRSKIEDSRSACKFTVELFGDRASNYVLGVDVARKSDNFAIAIGKIDGSRLKLVRVLTLNSKSFPAMHDLLRKCLAEYNVIYMCMDAGGGGLALEDQLRDPRMCPPGQKLIYDAVNNEENYENPGLHILEMIKFSDDSIPVMCHQLQADLDHGRFLFPSQPSACPNDVLAASGSSLEELEEAYNEIEQTIEETTSVVAQVTRTGRLHIGLPGEISASHKTSENDGFVAERKDRWTATMLANWAFYRSTRVEATVEPDLAIGFSLDSVIA